MAVNKGGTSLAERPTVVRLVRGDELEATVEATVLQGAGVGEGGLSSCLTLDKYARLRAFGMHTRVVLLLEVEDDLITGIRKLQTMNMTSSRPGPTTYNSLGAKRQSTIGAADGDVVHFSVDAGVNQRQAEKSSGSGEEHR